MFWALFQSQLFNKVKTSTAMTNPLELPHGPLMIDIVGLELTEFDRERLTHPLVGGLIIFGRNYQSTEQLSRLTTAVHALRTPPLVIAIDHEGGRVQRCRQGFTLLPPMRRLGRLWECNAQEALTAAHDIGYVLAAELRKCGIDLSFTPVLDLDWGRSSVIGDRSFHDDPAVVTQLAGALVDGLHRAGLAACGKHFPGHGWAEADSHVAMPVDTRLPAEIAKDIEPYRQLKLDAAMPAFVTYPQVDSLPAVFSAVWIGKLRDELGFDGAIFSDDLSMEGAGVAGGIVERVSAAWNAGCDMLLVCNAPDKVGDVLKHWQPAFDPVRSDRIRQLLPDCAQPGLLEDQTYLAGVYASQVLCK